MGYELITPKTAIKEGKKYITWIGGLRFDCCGCLASSVKLEEIIVVKIKGDAAKVKIAETGRILPKPRKLKHLYRWYHI